MDSGEVWRLFWRTCWTEAPPVARARLAVLLGLIAVLLVLVVDLANEAFLGLVAIVVQALS